MAVTAHFFGKLRTFALMMEKETQNLEHVFNKEDADLDGYEDECPMRVLHDLLSEVRAMKESIQNTTDQTHSKGEEIVDFLKACKVLEQRTAADLENLKELFEKYGYKSLPLEDQGKEQESGCHDSDMPHLEQLHKTDREQIEDKPSALGELPQTPQLSAFGLSHYHFQTRTMANHMAFNGIPALKEELKNIQAAIGQPELIMPKTPKCTLNMDDDALLDSCFPKLEPFSFVEYNMKLNDDYTIALINKRAQERKTVPEGKGIIVHAEPPTLLHDMAPIPVATIQLSHISEADNINSPLPPKFCTPGITRFKKENIKPVETPETTKSSVNESTPSAPIFQMQSLQIEAVQRKQETAPEVLPKLDIASEKHYMKDLVPLVMRSGRYFEDSTLGSFPAAVSIDASQLGTPQRPDMTTNITEKIIKHHVEIATPSLKILDYERMLQTPQRPEMASSLMSDIFKVLPNYYLNIKTPTPVKIESIKGYEGKMNSKHSGKENAENAVFIKYDI